MLKRLLLAALVLIPTLGLAGTIPLLHVGLASTPAAGSLKAPIFTTFRISAAGAAWFGAGPGTNTGGEQNSVATTSTTRRVPFPFAGTISHLHSNLTVAPTGTDTVTASKTLLATAADGTVTCTYAVVTGTTNNCSDDTHTDSYAAGDLFQAHFAVSDSQIQTTVGQLSWVATATNAQYVALWNQPNASGNVASSATPNFFAPGAGAGSATESTVSFQICPSCGGTILGFFLVPNVTETGTHTWTVNHNGSATGQTFNTSSATTGGGAAGQCISPNGASDSIGGGSSRNNCTSNSGLTFTVAAGDTISVSGNCPAGTGCATAIPGFAILYAPNTSGVVPLSASANFNATTSQFYGVNSTGINIAQVNYQQIPAGMTFSNYQYCSLTVPVSNTNTASFQVGATPGVVPTTPGTTLSVSYTNATGACPNNGGTFLAGGVDTNAAHNVTVTTDETIDTTLRALGGGSQTDKVNMAVTVP